MVGTIIVVAPTTVVAGTPVLARGRDERGRAPRPSCARSGAPWIGHDYHGGGRERRGQLVAMLPRCPEQQSALSLAPNHQETHPRDYSSIEEII